MATSLTNASVVSRKIIRYTILGIIGILIARYTVLRGVDLYKRLFPDPPPEATVKFGKLPELKFVGGDTAEGLNFILETVDGNLPSFPAQVIIYFMPKPQSSIRALEKARDTAANLGFGRNGRELVETVYLFPKGSDPSALSMNIVTGVFSISYNLSSSTQIFNRIPPSPEAAAGTVKGLLGNASLLRDLTGPVKHTLLRIESGELVEAISLSEANLIKVNLYRGVYGPEGFKLPSVTSDPDESNVWFILSSATESKVIGGEYHHFPIDPDTNSTYPTKTTNVAWEELKAGKAFVAKRGNNENDITIRNVSMAYFDSGQYAEYYQPVFVFEGDNDFVAYVPAITSEYYGKPQN